MANSDPPINLDGKVKLGIGTLMLIAAAIFTLAGVYGGLPSKEDIKELGERHNISADSHPSLANNLAAVRVKTERIEAHTERLEERQTETHADISYIRERVDYLTEQTVRQIARTEALQHTTPGRAQQAANTAVDNLRGGSAPGQAVKDSLDSL